MLHAFSDGSIFGDVIGSNTPNVLALHGWGRTNADFCTILNGLDAIALDLPGFGASPTPLRAWGAAEYAAAVLPILKTCASPTVIVGHSFGGRIAAHLGASHPELVRALVLTGVPLLRLGHGSSKSSLGFRLAKHMNSLGLIGDNAMEARRRRSGSSDYQAASGVMREILVRSVNEDYRYQLAAITCPVELVWGQDDTAAPVAIAEEAAAILGPLARLSVLPGVGHDTIAHAPGTVRAAIDAHLDRP
ncbi:MAG: alpha/beta fold hydrolase [Acidimicrobiales bacterium]